MTKLSRKQLPATQKGKIIEQLWRAFASLENKNEVHDFLHDILTHTEIEMLAKRLQVVVMLDQGFTYEQIKKALNISEATISKIQNWRQAFGAGYDIVIRKLRSGSKFRKVSNKVISSRSAAARIWQN